MPIMQDVATESNDPITQPVAGPPIAVVVTVLNERRAIDGLLDALLSQLGSRDELLIVDGGSNDGTAQAVEARIDSAECNLTVLERPGTNISEGRNAGIEHARNPVIACTDAGCLPAPGWLAALRSAFTSTPPPDLVTGVYEVAAEGPFEHAMSAACYPQVDETVAVGGFVQWYGKLLGRTFDPTLPTGRSMAFTKEAWERAGGFPEHLATSEDISFGRAIATLGGVCILEPKALVRWFQRPDARSTARMYYRYGVGGGRTGDAKLIGRDLLRAVAYPAGAALLFWGGPVGRVAAGAGAGLYLSVPLWRALRRPHQPFTSLLVPAAIALKDLSKAAGCLRGLVKSRS